ncbi:MAG: DUF6676 family protein [Nakamurella sp.]
MPQRHRRSGRLAAIAALLAAIGLVALTTPAAASALPRPAIGTSAAVSTSSLFVADTDTIGGVKIDTVVSELADDNVAVIGSRASESALAGVAADARKHGLQLSIVSLGVSLAEADAKLMAKDVQARVGGTVLVLTPDGAGQWSSELSGARQDDAKKAALSAGIDDVAAASAYEKSATAKGFPWVLVVVAIVVVAIAGAVVAGYLKRRRKQQEDHATLAELTAALNDRVGKLSPLVLAIAPRVDVANRPDLTSRFNQASSDYSTLRDRVATPLGSRKELDATTAEIADLEKRLGSLDQQLDTLLPGMEPPSPAG